MMKLLKIFVCSVSILLLFSACGTNNSGAASVEPISNANSSELKKDDASQQKIVKEIDVDLTKLSSTMVYSEVYQMIWHPEKYIGKIVKMNGAVSIFESPEMGRVYYTCVIADATACCQQGIEFRLIGDKALPSNYEEGNEVTVVGEFNTYKEGEKTYCELKNAKLL